MPPYSLSTFKLLGEKFFCQLYSEILQLGLQAQTQKPDHLCFRVATIEEYLEYKSFLNQNAKLLTETEINGRLICTFKLTPGFQTNLGEINLIELPAPKTMVPYPTGFEHAEFVIHDSFKNLKAKFPEIKFKGETSKILNSELALETQSGQIKFHYLPLNRVIQIEKAKITDIIFDFDGTILDSRSQIYQINVHVFSNILQREVTVEEAKQKFSPDFAGLFVNFQITDRATQGEVIKQWGETSNKFKFQIFQGTQELLDNLYHAGYKLHIWTGREQNSAYEILVDHKIKNYFTTFSFPDSVSAKPMASNLTFDWKQALPGSILMIGDTATDIKAAKNISAVAGAAMWDPYVDEQALVSAGAELFFERPDEMSGYLRI